MKLRTQFASALAVVVLVTASGCAVTRGQETAGAYIDEEDEDAGDEEPATPERPPRPSLVSAREELERRLAAARARRQAATPEEEEPVA